LLPELTGKAGARKALVGFSPATWAQAAARQLSGAVAAAGNAGAAAGLGRLNPSGGRMPTPAEITEKFWKSVKSDRTMMVGLAGVSESLAQPLTAQLDDDHSQGPIYFFTAKDADLVREMGGSHPATAYFTGKGHDLFASVEGELVADNDRATIERLWNPFVAAWFEGGKDDPNLQLLRFEPGHAQIWLNDHSLLAGVKLLLGTDPKKAYQDKTADVRLS
jgi:general stress protein 26